MSSFKIHFDADRGIVLCKVIDIIPDADVPALRSELTRAVRDARILGPLRALWDNRAGKPLSRVAHETVAECFACDGLLQDKIAVLVPDTMAKARARPSMQSGSELFASENAAITWLGAARWNAA